MTTQNTGFKALLEEIDLMVKALPAVGAETAKDDKKIEAAAAEGAAEGEKAEGETGKEPVVAAEGEDKDKPVMAKSFKLKLEDGTEVDAIDGSEMMKSLLARVETNETTVLGALTSAVKVIQAQGLMLKSLSDQVTAFANAGKGRKAVVTIAEPAKPAAEKEPEGMQSGEFMTKCIAAQTAGVITGSEVARVESYFNRGMQPPADIVQRVLAVK